MRLLNCLPGLFLIGVVLETPCSLGAEQAAGKPNILVILADDLGFGDLGHLGGKLPESLRPLEL